MNNMNITTAQYTTDIDGNNSSVQATIDGQEISFLCREGDDYYDEIMRQVEAGDLTIADAD
jgi:hypothetical protein